jgi:predicted 2-oxoglutarate/Fe(II)-dependent dioxygenase YbiX
MNDLLSNVLIQPKVITKDGIDFLLNHMKNSHQEQMGVFDPDATNETQERQSKIDLTARNVKCADLLPVFPQVKELLDNVVENVINPFYGFKVRDSEEPQLLCYEPGGHYKPHVDAEGLWTNPDGTQVYKKTIDRDLSTVLFLNDDFEGGCFTFPDLRVTIRPEPGLLICFPSSRWYRHGVEPVISGHRYTLVTWMRVQGFETKEEQDRKIEEKYGIKVP